MNIMSVVERWLAEHWPVTVDNAIDFYLFISRNRHVLFSN